MGSSTLHGQLEVPPAGTLASGVMAPDPSAFQTGHGSRYDVRIVQVQLPELMRRAKSKSIRRGAQVQRELKTETQKRAEMEDILERCRQFVKEGRPAEKTHKRLKAKEKFWGYYNESVSFGVNYGTVRHEDPKMLPYEEMTIEFIHNGRGYRLFAGRTGSEKWHYHVSSWNLPQEGPN